jgi:hypothetical protein
MHVQPIVKICKAQQARQIYQHKKIKIKLYKNNAAIWYNKACRIKQFFLNRYTGQSPAESDDTKDCIYTITTWTS